MSIYVVGSINMDLVICADVVPEKGQTLKGYGFMTNPGGKGANQAVAAAKSGAPAFMVGKVGKEFGTELIDTLAGYGVDTRYVCREEGVSSGIAVIVVSQGDNRILLDSGANGLVDETAVDKGLADAKAGDVLIVQLEIPVKTVEFALKLAKEKGMTTILNPAPACEIDEETFKYVDYFTPNQTETAFYTGIMPTDFAEAKAAAGKLKDTGVKTVIMTMGGEGAAVFADESYLGSAVKVKAIDSTAAGDTFVGAFAACLARGESVREAVGYANKAAAISVTRKGAQQSVPSREEVLK